MNKQEGVSDLDIWNKVAGVEIKRSAASHGFLYTFSKFKEAIQNDTNPSNKTILTALCLLFGAHGVLNFSGAVTEGGFLLPNHITSLMRLK